MTPKNMILTIKQPQAQNRFSRISILTGSRDGSRLQFCRPARRYLALLCIELLCKASQSIALQCIELLCITLLCITAQCIALQGIQPLHGKDPNYFANVRTRPLTDFIDFLGFKSVFVFGPVCALVALYE
jgi:hypothetical protein